MLQNKQQFNFCLLLNITFHDCFVIFLVNLYCKTTNRENCFNFMPNLAQVSSFLHYKKAQYETRFIINYYLLDDLLSETHKLVRDSARAWVKREVSPIIEEYAQKAEFPNKSSKV
jgi:hypothetical protein